MEKKGPFQEIEIQKPEMIGEFAIVKNFSAMVTDAKDQAVYSAIIDAAKKAGINSLLLMDRRFVLNALEVAIKRQEMLDSCSDAPTIEAEPVRIDGNTSDGYHTFNELYHHRAVLFSVIVKAFHQKAWKSRKHHDGEMYDGMFIVGIETPNGQATYHYDLEPYWDLFNCNEVEFAPEWDGHTPQQAIERIGKLEPVRHGRWIRDDLGRTCCSVCEKPIPCVEEYVTDEDCGGTYEVEIDETTYCPNCGAKMDLEG